MGGMDAELKATGMYSRRFVAQFPIMIRLKTNNSFLF